LKNGNIIKYLTRWLWIKCTGDDPVVVRGHFDALSSLNECHVRFIEQLQKEHPELKDIIETHQKDRCEALDRGYGNNI
jgi:hypothetical protein